MKKLIFILLSLFILCSYAFADYQSDIANATKAYKEGMLKQSLALFISAYKQKPTLQVKNYIIYIQNKIKKEGEDPALADRDEVYGDWVKKRTIITVNPMIVIQGLYLLHIETAIGNSGGIAVNAGGMFAGLGDMSLSAGILGFEYNIYFQNRALNGWYVGPIFNMLFIGETIKHYDYSQMPPVESTQSLSAFVFQAGGHAGYRWIWDSGFTLDLNLGLGYIGGNIAALGSGFTFSGVFPVGGCDLGFAW